jgi:hypothetical protein
MDVALSSDEDETRPAKRFGQFRFVERSRATLFGDESTARRLELIPAIALRSSRIPPTSNGSRWLAPLVFQPFDHW